MKTKRFDKTLALNKKTVANLDNGSMNEARGGVQWESYVDPTACAGDTATCICTDVWLNSACIG